MLGQKVYNINTADYLSLKTNGTLTTSSGKTYKYDSNAIYIISDAATKITSLTQSFTAQSGTINNITTKLGDIETIANAKQNKIDAEHKLDFSLLDDVPEFTSPDDVNALIEDSTTNSNGAIKKALGKKQDNLSEDQLTTLSTALTSTNYAATLDSHYLTEHQSLADYAKTSALPTKVSDLTNDSNFTTMSAVENKGYQKATDVTSLIESAVTDTNSALKQALDTKQSSADLATTISNINESLQTILENAAFIQEVEDTDGNKSTVLVRYTKGTNNEYAATAVLNTTAVTAKLSEADSGSTGTTTPDIGYVDPGVTIIGGGSGGIKITPVAVKN